MQRIAVVGTTGSGKTTLARQLSQHLVVPHVELDGLMWETGWTTVPDTVFRERTAKALSGERWVVDGNYSVVRDLVWERATTLIWLDYSLYVNLLRLTRRSLHRIITRQELWNGNRETFRGQFLSRDSLYVWAVKTHGKRRLEFPVLLTQPQYAHLQVFHFRSPRQTAQWLAQI